MSLMEALSKRGVIDKTDIDATFRDAGSYAQALCVDCSHEVESAVQQLLAVIGKTAGQDAGTPPIPLVGPA
jgi:hypothetical protein